MGNFFVALLIAVIVAMLVIAGVGAVLAAMPGFEHVDASTALVYPDGAVFLLATSQGPYIVGDPLVSGCYYLAAPGPGETYGRAVMVWFSCK